MISYTDEQRYTLWTLVDRDTLHWLRQLRVEAPPEEHAWIQGCMDAERYCTESPKQTVFEEKRCRLSTPKTDRLTTLSL